MWSTRYSGVVDGVDGFLVKSTAFLLVFVQPRRRAYKTEPRVLRPISVGSAVLCAGALHGISDQKVNVMGSWPAQSNLTTKGDSRVTLRKAFAFFGWSLLCAAIGFSVAGEQWADGIDSILHPHEMASGISTQNLSSLEVCFAGMLISAVFATAYFVRGCFLLLSESHCEMQSMRRTLATAEAADQNQALETIG